jgi:hypothetical protein
MKEITMGELSEMVSSMTLMGLPQYSEETEENMMPYETGSGAGRTSSTLAGWATRTLPSLPTVLEKSDEEAATREAKVVLIKVKADIVVKERLGEGGKERARVRWCVAGSCTALNAQGVDQQPVQFFTGDRKYDRRDSRHGEKGSAGS